MHRFREAVDRDPYDAMFGWSNDMLKGKPLKGRWFWDDPSEAGRGMWTVRAIKEEAEKNHERWRLQMASRGRVSEGLEADVSKPAASPLKDAQPLNKKVKVKVSKSEELPVKKSQPQPDIQAYSQWSYQSTDSTGKSIQSSGASTYDPISGRMVPVEQKRMPETAAQKPLPSSPPKVPAVKNTETISDNLKYQFAETRERMRGVAWLMDHEKEVDESLEAARSAQRDPVKANEATERDQLYKKTERSLVVAQESITAMIETDPTRHQVAVRPENQVKALRTTQLGKTLLCLRNIQLSLEHYKASVNTLARLSNRPTAEELAAGEIIEKKRKLESSWRRDEKRPASARDPHFKQLDVKSPLKDYAADSAARQAYESLHRHRHAPLKYMNSHELQNHRALLLRSWKKQNQQSQPSQTEAQKRLTQEVDAQKNMYTAWENRWSRKTPAPALAPASMSSVKPTRSVSNPIPQQAAPAIAAEGDMCPNVSKYCNSERIYKRKAPHAILDDDPALVQKIKSIYEETYGTINADHRQQKLDQEMFDTTRSSLWRGSATSSTNVRDAAASESARPLTAMTRTYSPLVTSLQRHQNSSKPSQEASTSASSLTQTAGSGSPNATQPTAQSSPYIVIEYNESKLSSNTRSVASHPDGWSTPRISPNTILENLRSKMGYSAVLLPQIKKLREQGYVLWDLARDDKSIIFKLQTPRPAPMSSITKPEIATSLASGSDMKPTTIAASSNIPKDTTINPVDLSLRSPPQTQTGNFASPTGFVNLDRPTDSVVSSSDGNSVEAASAYNASQRTEFDMLVASASQATELTPEQVQQQRKELDEVLRRRHQEQYQQQQKQQSSLPASAKPKSKVKRQERVYYGGRHENRSQTSEDEFFEPFAFHCTMILVLGVLFLGLYSIITSLIDFDEPSPQQAEIEKVKSAALKGAREQFEAESGPLREQERQLRQQYDAERARIIEASAAASKSAAAQESSASAEVYPTPEAIKKSVHDAVSEGRINPYTEAEAMMKRYYDAAINGGPNPPRAAFEADLVRYQALRDAQRGFQRERPARRITPSAPYTEPGIYEDAFRAGLLQVVAGTDHENFHAWQDLNMKDVHEEIKAITRRHGLSEGHTPRVASVFWQDGRRAREAEMQVHHEKELKHPVTVAFVEAATLSLSLGAVGWIFLRMLQR